MSDLEKENNLYLGIDGGGSKCRAIISDDQDRVLGTGVSGPANPLHGFQKSLDSILAATHLALNDANLGEKHIAQLIAGIGLAGVNLPALYQQVQSWQHPFKQMHLTTDLDIASLGAHGGDDGAVIIVGTGSCGFVSVGQQKLTFGGHGFPIGDIASGAWMGLEAIRHTLQVLDGFKDSSILSDSVKSFYQVDEALTLSEKVAGRSSRQYAKLAKVIFNAADEGDLTANAIVNQGIDYISRMTRSILSKSPKRLSMIGGLAPLVLSRLPDYLSEQFVEPIAQPETGAVLFARQQQAPISGTSKVAS
ncbi:N-acetylglucosamine kinase [Aliikangiella sp. G2MR2-5]|uniref:N-acetylglucosamine kinase n=1 Tax=Aliikangiella sp. G2MR2-5 TaxID=2788943 RepID=UPI001AEF1EC2